MGPFGSKFVANVKAEGRQLFVWTVNEKNMMRWSIRKEVDGVITDDPEKFKEVCENWDPREPDDTVSLRQFLFATWIWLLVAIFGFLLRIKYRDGMGRYSRR
jgi:phosphatidylglycerol phospholipase C